MGDLKYTLLIRTDKDRIDILREVSFKTPILEGQQLGVLTLEGRILELGKVKEIKNITAVILKDKPFTIVNVDKGKKDEEYEKFVSRYQREIHAELDRVEELSATHASGSEYIIHGYEARATERINKALKIEANTIKKQY